MTFLGRLVAFAVGALFGAVGVVLNFRWMEAPVTWWVVAVGAGVMGSLAAAFGRRFWDFVIGLWP